MCFAVRNLLVLVVLTSSAGTGSAFMVRSTHAEYGQCGLDRLTQHTNKKHVVGPSRRVRRTRLDSAIFARSKISDEELEERKEQLRKLLCATKAEIDKLVRHKPDLLLRSDMVQAYRPKLTLLQDRLGIDQKAAGKLCLVTNRLLTISLETLRSKMDWLQARLNLNKAQLQKIMKRAHVSTHSIEDHIEPSLKNIQSVLELNDKDLTKMVARAPDLLNHNISTEKLAAQLSLLRDLLGIEEDDFATLRKAIAKSPDILYWSEDKMLGTQHWISERLGLSDSRIAQMCRNFPELLMSKIETLEEKVASLQTALSLSDEELCKLFGQFPPLFGLCPKKNIEPKLRFLRMTFELNDEALREMLLRRPGLFSSSEETIEKKLKFYTKLIGGRAARELVVERPYLIANYSLEKRLEPRLEEVRMSGEKVIWDATLINRLAARTDALWEKYGLRNAKQN